MVTLYRGAGLCWQKVRCGTTGVVTFLRGRTLYVAWLGDSQVMLVKKGQAVELMKPHKPDREVITHTHTHTHTSNGGLGAGWGGYRK